MEPGGGASRIGGMHTSSDSGSTTRRLFLGAAGAAAAGIALGEVRSGIAAETASESVAAPAKLPLTILLRQGWPPEDLERLRAISPQINILQRDDSSGAIDSADALFGNVRAEELASAKRLKWVQCASAGVEHLPLQQLVERDITLTNAKGCYAPEIAEHVFGLLFGLTRGIAHQVRQMREHRWGFSPSDAQPALIELPGMTMGLIGLGGIGRQAARRAKAMEMRVIAVDAEPITRERVGGIVDEVHLVDEWLEEMLKQSDVVVTAAPSTPRTRGMLGEKQFAAMKRGSYLIAVSRGKVVQTDALVSALRDRHLAGAGLDVTDPEPLPPDHALWEMPNVIITSHTAGQSPPGSKRVREVFLENVRRHVAGLPLLNVVDKRKGY